MGQFLADWGSLITSISIIIGAIVAIVKFFKKTTDSLKEAVEKIVNDGNAAQNDDIKALIEGQETLKKDVEALSEMVDNSRFANQAALRSTIVNVYYKYKDCDEIPFYEKENLDKLYAAYQAVGGNSFVSKLYEELSKKSTKMI